MCEWMSMNECIWMCVYLSMCKYVCVCVCVSTTNNKYNWPASTNEFNNNNLVAWLALGLLSSPSLSPPLPVSLYLCLVFFQLICNFCLSVCLPANTDNSNNGKSFRNWSKFPYTSISTQFPRWAALRAVLCCAVDVWIASNIHSIFIWEWQKLLPCVCVSICVVFTSFPMQSELVQLFHPRMELILLMAT